MTALPIAMASATGMPHPSPRVGMTYTSADRYKPEYCSALMCCEMTYLREGQVWNSSYACFMSANQTHYV